MGTSSSARHRRRNALQNHNSSNNSNENDIHNWKEADELLGREFSSSSSSAFASSPNQNKNLKAAAAMLNSEDVEIVGLSNASEFGKNFSIAGSFESSSSSSSLFEKNNNNNTNTTTNQHHPEMKDPPFVVSISPFLDDNIDELGSTNNNKNNNKPAIKLSPWHVLFSTPPSSLSCPVEECGILMVDDTFLFSSGTDLPTIPAFRALHDDFWRTILETDYQQKFGMMMNENNNSISSKNNNNKRGDHPMSDLTLDLIITLCNKKMTNVLNEFGKQISYYEN